MIASLPPAPLANARRTRWARLISAIPAPAASDWQHFTISSDPSLRRRQGGLQAVPSCGRAPVEHASTCPRLHGLHGAALPRAVQHLQLRHDDLLDERVRLGGKHVAMRILLEDLDAGPVHQKGVVQDEEVVIKNAERVTLFASDNSMYRTV